MNENKYRTLVHVSQSNISALQLIHSGFLALIVDIIIGEYSLLIS